MAAPDPDNEDDMRRLVLFRHGKAEAAEPGRKDRDRRLAERGRRSAALVGDYLAHHALVPDFVLCSPALRTRETWRLAAERLPASPRLQEDDRLYGAEAAAQEGRGFVFDHDAQLADAPRRFGPAPVGTDERRDMPFVVEARHRVVRLGLELGVRQASLRIGAEQRQPPAMNEIVHERRDEHGLAGARQARDAQPDGRVPQAGNVILQALRSDARVVEERGGHGNGSGPRYGVPRRRAEAWTLTTPLRRASWA